MSDNEKKELEFLQKHFDAISDLNYDAVMATFHPDVVVYAPFRPEVLKDTVPDETKGKQAVSDFYKVLLEIVAPLRFYDLNIEPLKEPGEYVCRFKGNSKFLTTDRPYCNRYISRISVRDGLVYRISEYFDPIILVTAMGGTVTGPQV